MPVRSQRAATAQQTARTTFFSIGVLALLVGSLLAFLIRRQISDLSAAYAGALAAGSHRATDRPDDLFQHRGPGASGGKSARLPDTPPDLGLVCCLCRRAH